MADSGNEIPRELHDRYIRDGFTEDEITQIWKDTLVIRKQISERKNIEQREITSGTYMRAQKRLTKRVNDFLGIR